ncbi:MAG: hypothetical protein NTZ24_13490 [Deltaproteobacteria bacterium]|nr:hypothetical protein [Deltaproteobacteria bacterium]
MMNVIKEETIQFSNQKEHLSVKTKLESDPVYASIRWTSDDNKYEITYETEEITPTIGYDKRIKVLLLFKNPHPDSVAAGLFLSEPHSQAFWNRLFEVDFNRNLLPLLNKRDWISSLADTLLTGKYDSPFLYYFRCLYPFPTRQFADLQQLFAGAPSTYRREILGRSLTEFTAYVEQNGIRSVIVFFKDAVELLGGRALSASINTVAAAKQGIDQAIEHGDDSLFWQQNSSFRQETKDELLVYLNMNTRAKNHGTHLPKRYFTYNLEFILRDILKNSPAPNKK